jgi:hypothetical protein
MLPGDIIADARKPAWGKAERQHFVNAMTNHERNQWARAGYPQDKETFLRYAEKAVLRRQEEMLS